MSSENNHQTSIINLANYEDFFILYMDGELNDVQAEMVENFLTLHPHLQTEMDLLMNTRLPVEDLNFDKSSLFSPRMQAQSLQEELLLLIDDELPADKKKTIELEIAANDSYQKQLQLLSAAKLNAAEKFPHPHKKELYRHTKKVVLLQPWMRIAAVFLLMASLGIIYWMQQGKSSMVDVTAGVNTLPKKPAVPANNNAPGEKETAAMQQHVPPTPVVAAEREKSFVGITKSNKNNKTIPVVANNQLAVNTSDIAVAENIERQNTIINHSSNNNHTRPQLQHSQISNAGTVTSVTAGAYKPVVPAGTPVVFPNPEHNIAKGSLKSFLRKAGRTITRTAGLSSEDGDDETLIGVVAVKLK